MKRYAIGLIAALSCAFSVGSAAQTPTSRGQALYEQHCAACHSAGLHKRTPPAAKNYQDIRKWVTHWKRAGGPGWELEDIEAVVEYLNQRFYKYPCPTDRC